MMLSKHVVWLLFAAGCSSKIAVSSSRVSVPASAAIVGFRRDQQQWIGVGRGTMLYASESYSVAQVCVEAKHVTVVIDERSVRDTSPIIPLDCETRQYGELFGEIAGLDSEIVAVRSFVSLGSVVEVTKSHNYKLAAPIGVGDALIVSGSGDYYAEWSASKVAIARNVEVGHSAQLNLDASEGTVGLIEKRVRLNGLYSGEIGELVVLLTTARGASAYLTNGSRKPLTLNLPVPTDLKEGDVVLSRVMARSSNGQRVAKEKDGSFELAPPLGDVLVRGKSGRLQFSWPSYSLGAGYSVDVDQLRGDRLVMWRVRIGEAAISNVGALAYAMPDLSSLASWLRAYEIDLDRQADWRVAVSGRDAVECSRVNECSGIKTDFVARRWGVWRSR